MAKRLVNISADSKLLKLKDPKVIGYSVLTKLADAIYGTHIKYCFGRKMTISKKRTENNRYIVTIPNSNVMDAKHSSLPKTIGNYINSVISHCKSNNVSISLVIG